MQREEGRQQRRLGQADEVDFELLQSRDTFYRMPAIWEL